MRANGSTCHSAAAKLSTLTTKKDDNDMTPRPSLPAAFFAMGRMSSHPPRRRPPKRRRDGEDMRGGGGGGKRSSSCGRTTRRRRRQEGRRGADDGRPRASGVRRVVFGDSAAAAAAVRAVPRPHLPLVLLALVVLLLLEVHTNVAQAASVLFPAFSSTRRGGSGATSLLAFQPTLGSIFLNVRGGGGGRPGAEDRPGASSEDSDRVTTRQRRNKRKRRTAEPPSSSSSLSPKRTTTTRRRKKATHRAHSTADDEHGAAHSGPTTASSSAGRRHQRRRHRRASNVATTIRKSSPGRADDTTQSTHPGQRKRKMTRRKGIASHLSSSSSSSSEAEGRDSRARRTPKDVGDDHREESEAESSDARPRTEVEGGSSPVASSRLAAVGPSAVGPLKERRKKKKKRSKAMPSTSGGTTVAERQGAPAGDGMDREATTVVPDAMEPALVEPARDGDADADADGPVATLSMPPVAQDDVSDEVVIDQGVAVAEDADTIVVGETLVPLQPQVSGGVDAWEDGTAAADTESATHAAAGRERATRAAANDGDDHDDDEEHASPAAEAQEDQGDESVDTVLPSIPELSAAADADAAREVAQDVSDEPAEVHFEPVAADVDIESIGRPLPTDEAPAFGAENDAVGDAEALNDGTAVPRSPPAHVTVHVSPLLSSLAGSMDESALSGAVAQPNPSHGNEDDASTPNAALDGAPSEGESESLGEASHDAFPDSVVGATTGDARGVILSVESQESESPTANANPEEDDDDDEGDDDEEDVQATGERLPAVDDGSVMADEMGPATIRVSSETSPDILVSAVVPGESLPPADIAATQNKPDSGMQTSVIDVDVPGGQNEEEEDGDEDGDDASTGAHDSSFGESMPGENEEITQGERDAEAGGGVGVGSESLEEESDDVVAAADTSNTGTGVPGQFAEDTKGAESDDHDNDQRHPLSLDGSVASQVAQRESVPIPNEGSNNVEADVDVLTIENESVSVAEESQSKLEDSQTRFDSEAMVADFDRGAVSRAADSDSDLLVSVVTWNLAEESPSEEDAAFIRKFRRSKSKAFPGSDFVLIAGQECENIKPRRTEGHRSREFRRLMIKMLGKQFVPIAMHQLGGIQLGLFCKQELISDLEHVSVADVTCGIGNVFHNKGAIGAFVQLKAQNPPATGATSPRRTKSLRMLFITAHMAAHVKNTDARDADFARIATELEAQAPPDFLSHLQKSDPSNRVLSTNGGGGSTLFDALDRVFFCGDLNYRIDVPREEAEHSLVKMNELFDAGATKDAEAIRLGLLRHDQLLSSIAEQRAFQGFAEGRIAFAPTFKYDKSTGDYDTSHKQRIPAWTDRVLFKPDGVRVVEYASVPEARHSDHRPVLATFRVSRSGRALSASDTERRRKPTKTSSRYQADKS